MERVIRIAPTGTQLAWGKSVWPNLVWGSSYLYGGAWGDVPYQSLIEFRLPEQVVPGGRADRHEEVIKAVDRLHLLQDVRPGPVFTTGARQKPAA